MDKKQYLLNLPEVGCQVHVLVTSSQVAVNVSHINIMIEVAAEKNSVVSNSRHPKVPVLLDVVWFVGQSANLSVAKFPSAIGADERLLVDPVDQSALSSVSN